MYMWEQAAGDVLCARVHMHFVTRFLRLMARLHVDSLINHQAALSLPKARLVSLQNDLIRSGRVSLISCGCPSNVTSVVTHADLARQNIYVSGCSDGSIGVWDRSKKALLRVQHTDVPISSMAVAPSSSFYAVGHSTGMLSFWNCADLLSGKEAPAASASIASTAELLKHQSNSGVYNITLVLAAGCSPIAASYCRVTIIGEFAEASASLLDSIDGSRVFQAGLPLVFRIESSTWLGPLSKVTLAVDSVVADVRSMFGHVTISCCDDVKYTFKPQGEGSPAPVLTYFIVDKGGSISQDFIVHVYTGGDFGAGTDSKVVIEVQGVNGEVQLALQQSLTHSDAFERGHHDIFFISLSPAERVGEVTKCDCLLLLLLLL
jgi:hypothetical protein